MLPFDISKLRKKVDKSIASVSMGFNDPRTWLDTGCYALNYLISNDFKGGVPLEGKFSLFAGDSGSGKSYIVSANIVKDAQAKGIFVVLVDTENALDESWMQKFGIDTSPDKMVKLSAASVDEVTMLLMWVVQTHKEEHGTKPYAERPKMLLIIDSVGMMVTPQQLKQSEEGDQKGDLGLKAKQVTHMLRSIMASIASQPIGLVATNHVYDSQDQYKPDKMSGGKMLEFASSVLVQMNKFLDRTDENEVKLADGEIAGIRSSAVVRKSRYAKPFERVWIRIPYDQGMDPHSGLFDLFCKKGLLTKSGNRWEYTSRVTGEVFCDFRKNLKSAGILDQIMGEQSTWDSQPVNNGFDETTNEVSEDE